MRIDLGKMGPGLSAGREMNRTEQIGNERDGAKYK